MGRAALLIALLAGAGACAPVDRADASPAGHEGIACAACHSGGLSDRAIAAVRQESCTASGCHADGGPGEVLLLSVRFRHRHHGEAEIADAREDAPRGPEVGCAGCHTHASGDAPLVAGAATCGLCHAAQLSGTRSEACVGCHADGNQAPTTSQGLPVDHHAVPWLEGGCVRCHYAVSRPADGISLGSCAACHEDTDRIRAAGIGENLHPLHSGNACTACHAADNHRIEAMSSAVELTCGTCHSVEHEVDVEHGWLDPAACNACHGGAHRAVQALLLGILPGEARARPSEHFMDGLTCRSCHLPPGTPSGRPADATLVGTAEACVGCHRAEYATVLSWWGEGLERRIQLVEEHLDRVEGLLAAPDGSRPAALAEARERLRWIREGGGWHNLPLAHALLGEALDLAGAGWVGVAGEAPAPPALGRAPRQGLCSFCHYLPGEPRVSEAMDDPFHREVVGR